VLTAAHCIDRGSSACFKLGDATHYIDSVRHHPEHYPISLDDHVIWSHADLAVLSLERPSEIDPLPLEASAPGRRETVRLVGFGKTSDDEAARARPKRTGTDWILRVRPSFFETGGQPSGVCLGDSGGPVLREAEEGRSVLGVASYTADPFVGCGGAGGMMRVDAFLDWILEQAPEARVVERDSLYPGPAGDHDERNPWAGKADGDAPGEAGSAPPPPASCSFVRGRRPVDSEPAAAWTMAALLGGWLLRRHRRTR
jgi:hypothetical protein